MPTPITILTGFLGAGKTSLLNTMLRHTSGERIAVLVNDFGAINIDADLVESVRDNTVNLRNGCVCCSIRGDLLAAVLALLRRAEPPDSIIIECSGVADPVAVARTFMLPELRSFVQLEATIAVVDAELVHTYDEYQDLIADQIAAADIVVLNKVDLASNNLRAGLHEWIRSIVPDARILEAQHGQVPLALLLGTGVSRAEAWPATERNHEAEFRRWSFVADRPFRFQALRHALAALPVGIYRAKGVLWLAEEPQRQIIFQHVGRRSNVTPTAAWGDLQPQTRLVVIGTPESVDPDALQTLFEGCLAR